MTTNTHSPLTTAEPDEVLAAIEALDLNAPWAEIAADLRIALPRRRAMPPGLDHLPLRVYEPGIPAGLALDIGPAMLFVGDEQLTGWGVSADEAFDQATANVRDRVAARDHFALVHERIADVPTLAFQSREGWASSLLLLPEELTTVLGERNGLVLAPMRDLLLCLPLDADPAFAAYLLEEFAAVDMNALDLPPYALVDGELQSAPPVRRSAVGGAPMH